MASTNDVTGDSLISRAGNENYRDNYDRIFGKKNGKLPEQKTTGDCEEVAMSELRRSKRDSCSSS